MKQYFYKLIIWENITSYTFFLYFFFSGLQRSKLPQSTSQLMQDVQMKSLSPENEDSVHGHLLFKQPLPAVLRYGINISK